MYPSTRGVGFLTERSWSWGDRREQTSSNNKTPSGGPSGEYVLEGPLCFGEGMSLVFP